MMILMAASALIIAVVACVIYKLFFSLEKNSKLIVHGKDHEPFVLERLTDKSAEFSARVGFENLGGQYATIVDCIVRPQLPFEQYDGVDVRGKAEVDGRPRDDDYFEAVLVDPHSTLPILMKVKLMARKDTNIKEALSHMVDLPLDIIFTELGRFPWKLKKFRIVLSAEEIAKLAGVKLASEQEGEAV